MTVLVTGAAGFVGCHIVEAVAQRWPGRRVVAADQVAPDPVATALFASLSDVTPMLLDVTDRAAVGRLLAEVQPEVVVHGAAVTPSPATERADPIRIVDVNTGGLANLLHAAGSAGCVQRIVFLSSTGVFGPEAVGGDETTDPRPDNLYAVTKRAGEDLLRRWGELTGTPIASLRLGTIFGRFERPTPARGRMSAVARLVAAGTGGRTVRVYGPDVERDWLCGDDLGNAVASVLAAPELLNPLYHLCGARHRWDEVVATTAIPAQWVDDSTRADVAMTAADRRAAVSVARFHAEFGNPVRTPLREALAPLMGRRSGAV